MQTLSLSGSEMRSEPVLYVHNLAFKSCQREILSPELKLMNQGDTIHMHVNWDTWSSSFFYFLLWAGNYQLPREIPGNQLVRGPTIKKY